MERFVKYLEDVENNRILTCEWVKLAVRRFRDDQIRSKNNDPNFPYQFNVQKAWEFISFAESMKQYKDIWKGLPLKLENWQVFILGNLYGWEHKETHLRRFRKCFIFVARKNGKTMMVSPALLFDCLFTPGGEAYCAATKRDQSKIVLENCREMMKQSQVLSDQLLYYRSTKVIVNEEQASKIVALSRDSDKLDGINPSVVVCDEVAAMKDYSMIKILSSGQYSRPEPLMIEITSGSDDVNSAGAQEVEASKRILTRSYNDETYFTVLYTLDEGDDWKNPNVWIKANPNLGVSVFMDKLIAARDEALIKPEMEAEFRVKNCCQFISPVTAWISANAWGKVVENAQHYPFPSDLSDCVCVGAVDLSQRVDFTSYSLYWYQPSTGMYWTRHKIYIPSEQVEPKCGTDTPLVRHWIEKGIVTATPGAVVNYSIMIADIKEDIEKYNPKEILYDPWNAGQLISEISPFVDLVECKQNLMSLSPMAKDWEQTVIEGKIVDDNPCVSWQVTNTDCYRDPNGNIKPVKRGGKKSTKHIDTVVSSVMCLGRLKQMERDGQFDFRSMEEIMADMERELDGIEL